MLTNPAIQDPKSNQPDYFLDNLIWRHLMIVCWLVHIFL